MPFDGISYTEPGYKITPPSEMNIHAEMVSQNQAKTFVKKLDESQKVQPDDKNKQNSNNQNSKKEENNEEEFYDENSPEFANKSKIIKKYKVSFNQENNMIELVDRKTGGLVETISPSDLLNIVSKSKIASGILVDRKI